MRQIYYTPHIPADTGINKFPHLRQQVGRNKWYIYICLYTYIYIFGYTNLSAFFAAALQHFIFCCKASFCCNAGIRNKPQHGVWYIMKLKEPVYQESCYVSIMYGTFQDPQYVSYRHKKYIGPIAPISSTIPSPWIQPLPKGTSDVPRMSQRATVPGKCAVS